MLAQRLITLFLFTLMLAAGFWSTACSDSANEKKSSELEPPTASNNSAPLTPQVASATRKSGPSDQSTNAAPKPDEVRATMARVFNKAVTWDENNVAGYFVGDFNGDGSEDIAVVSTASDNSLPEINNELANWTLEDPRMVPIPGTKAAEQALPPKRTRAERGDTLLAIIHGVGAQGWRNREARQTYLLKNGAGSNILVPPLKKLRGSDGNAKLPTLRGDVISEVLGGKAGLLFWTGAKYAWSAAK